METRKETTKHTARAYILFVPGTDIANGAGDETLTEEGRDCVVGVGDKTVPLEGDDGGGNADEIGVGTIADGDGANEYEAGFGGVGGACVGAADGKGNERLTLKEMAAAEATQAEWGREWELAAVLIMAKTLTARASDLGVEGRACTVREGAGAGISADGDGADCGGGGGGADDGVSDLGGGGGISTGVGVLMSLFFWLSMATVMICLSLWQCSALMK